MVPLQEVYGFSAEYLGDSPAYDDFEKFLRLEFDRKHPGWEPSFGRVSRYDDVKSWNYAFLLTGNVPGATSLADAEEKARRLVHELGERMKSALPVPKVQVWRRSPGPGGERGSG